MTAVDFSIGVFGEPGQCPPPAGQSMCVHADYVQVMRGILGLAAQYARGLESQVASLTWQLADAQRRLDGRPWIGPSASRSLRD